jgi:hypothetical protein
MAASLCFRRRWHTVRGDSFPESWPFARPCRSALIKALEKAGFHLMNASWIILGVGLVVAVVILATSWFRRHQDFDLWTVSHQWIAEQRFGQGHDPRR